MPPLPDNSTESFDAGLFADERVAPSAESILSPDAPLAARMRPRTLDEFAGQENVVGPGTLLRRAIEQDRLTSVLFWGPPGSGKSTLAQIIARTTKAKFENYSAVTSGVADIRKVIEQAKERRKKLAQKTILFIDEIHRWNKSQQDALLPHVEDGTVALIGATTENPYFRGQCAAAVPFAPVPVRETQRRGDFSAPAAGFDRPGTRTRQNERHGEPGRAGISGANCGRRRPQRPDRAGSGSVRDRPGRKRRPAADNGNWRKKGRRPANWLTIRRATSITTRFRLLSSPCAALTPTRRCTGSARC